MYYNKQYPHLVVFLTWGVGTVHCYLEIRRELPPTGSGGDLARITYMASLLHVPTHIMYKAKLTLTLALTFPKCEGFKALRYTM